MKRHINLNIIRREMSKNGTRTISGKELTELLGIDPQEYLPLYPNIGSEKYCPCSDVGLNDCHSMYTVMEALARPKIPGFPRTTRKHSDSKYKTGEVWLDTFYSVAYLYLGKTANGRDVAMNLGGDTGSKGEIAIGRINKNEGSNIFFDTKVFPRG
jgi:hypothetical protein